MKHLRVWFNKSFSSIYNVIRRLTVATSPHSFHVLCSHTNAEFVGFEPASESFVEPAGMGEAAYLQYALEFCEQHGVEVFAPGRARIELAAHREAFERLGVKLLVPAPPETLRLFEDKPRFYATLAPEVALAPRHRVVRTVAEFSDAVAALRAEAATVCIKPGASTGGLGFHILDDSRSDLRNLLGGEAIRMTTALATHILGQEAAFRDMLVMEYLSGAEYSIDCVAHHGDLVCAVPRRKSTRVGGGQILEAREDLVSLAGRVAGAYGLDGIFNVQVRELDGVPKVLEINARMSGGVYFACLSGVDLPAWALALAAGTATAADVPPPQFGMAVHQQYHEFVLTNPHGAAK